MSDDSKGIVAKYRTAGPEVETRAVVVRRPMAAIALAKPLPEPEEPQSKHEEASQPKSAASEPIDPHIEALNQKHAVIANAGGKTVIAYWGPADPSDPDSRQEISYHRVGDFTLQYSNRRVEYQVASWTGGMKTETVELGNYWLKHRHRRQYLGIVFVPEAGERMNDCLNLWRGWGVTAKPQAEWDRIRQHVFEVVCGGIPEDRELEHAKIAGPSIEVIDEVFNAALSITVAVLL